MHTLESLSVYVYVTAGELVGGIRARNVGQEKKKGESMWRVSVISWTRMQT